MIRNTFTAVPQRGSVLAVNVTIFALLIFAVSAVAPFAAFFASQAIRLRRQRGPVAKGSR